MFLRLGNFHYQPLKHCVSTGCANSSLSRWSTYVTPQTVTNISHGRTSLVTIEFQLLMNQQDSNLPQMYELNNMAPTTCILLVITPVKIPFPLHK